LIQDTGHFKDGKLRLRDLAETRTSLWGSGSVGLEKRDGYLFAVKEGGIPT